MCGFESRPGHQSPLREREAVTPEPAAWGGCAGGHPLLSHDENGTDGTDGTRGLASWLVCVLIGLIGPIGGVGAKA